MAKIDYAVDFILRMNGFVDECDKAIKDTKQYYLKTKEELKQQQIAEINQVHSIQQNATNQLSAKCSKIKSGISSFKKQLEKLEGIISRVDKYYQRSKDKTDIIQPAKLDTTDDYLQTLQSVVTRYEEISQKYTEKTLPFIINDINYFLSAKRKNDYQELLSLFQLGAQLEKEAKDNLEQLQEDEKTEIDNNAASQIRQINAEYQSSFATAEQEYITNTELLADSIYKQMEKVLPSNEIEYFQQIKQQAVSRQNGINTNLYDFPGKLMLFTYLFPLSEYISSSIIISLLADHCKSVAFQKNILVFPAEYNIKTPLNLMFKGAERSDYILKSIHQIVYSFLNQIPVSKLKLAIVDPEHHGNSISPFYELQRVEPEIFMGDIAVSQEDITKLITSISDRIDETIRYRLNGDDDTVYDSPETAETVLLLLFDYPAHMDDNSLSLLRNILRNGHRSGIHTVIMNCHKQTSSVSNERNALIEEIDTLCSIITSEGDVLYTRGLECLFPMLPDTSTLNGYINKYLLTYSGLKNEGFIFHPAIKDLITAIDADQVAQAIESLQQLSASSEKSWGQALSENVYPESIVLGGAYYPFSLFDGHSAEIQLREHYKVENRKGVGIKQDYIFMPYCVNLREGLNIYIEYSEKEYNKAFDCIYHVMWSMVYTFPVSKIKFNVVSCERSFNAIAPFIELQKKVPDLFEDGICASSENILERLKKISQYIDDALQNKLGTKHNNIIDYNLATPNRAEPITILTIFDYPKGFDSSKNELLWNIMRNGRKCGVFVIVCHNTDIQYSKYDQLDSYLSVLKKNSIQMMVKGNSTLLQPYGLELDMSQLPNIDEIPGYAELYKEKYEQMQRKGINFNEILDKDLFLRSSSKSLTIPIGLGDGDSVISISFGMLSSHHALIAGATGSGKSTLLHTLIMSSMCHYSPSQLNLYLLDFKSGTEFKAYERARLPHLKLLALDAMQEFGESILEDLVAEMTRRSDEFKAAGCSKVQDYVSTTGKELPRILVIMDEFQILYNDHTNRRVANNCAELTKRLITEGRAFGIHLIMATQSTKVLSNLALESGTIEQMRIRIGMKCGEYDAHYMFGDLNERRALQMMKGPQGTAVLNQEYTESDNIGLRVAYCPQLEMDKYQKTIEQQYADIPYTLQTFEGSRTTDLLEFIAANDLRSSYSSPDIILPLGIMIKVAPPLSLTIDRKKRHNMLICGANERMTNNIVLLYQLAVLRNQAAEIIDMNGEWLVTDDYSDSVSCAMTGIASSYRTCTSRNEVAQAIVDLYTVYEQRKNEGYSGPIVVFIRNLQYLDLIQSMLRGDRIKEEDYIQPTSTSSTTPSMDNLFDFGQSIQPSGNSLTDKLNKVIIDGSGYGIFFVITSAEYQVVKDCMYFGDNMLSKFPERIVYSLSDNDAERLIDGIKVSTMRDNTVYFCDNVKPPFQFKPHIAPSQERLIAYMKELKGS